MNINNNNRLNVYQTVFTDDYQIIARMHMIILFQFDLEYAFILRNIQQLISIVLLNVFDLIRNNCQHNDKKQKFNSFLSFYRILLL